MQAGNVNQCPTTEYVNHRARRTDAEPITYGSIPMVIGFAFEKSWLNKIKSGGFEKIRAAILILTGGNLGGCRHAITGR